MNESNKIPVGYHQLNVEFKIGSKSDSKKCPGNWVHIKVIGITGKKAASLFDKYLLDKVNIPVVYLPSTSPANVKMSVDDLIKNIM